MNLYIINMDNIRKHEISLVSNAYNLYRETYFPILDAAKEVFKPEYFYTEKILILIADAQGSPIAFALSSFKYTFLPDMEKTSYLNTAGSFSNHLSTNKDIVMNISWVTVHPNFRGKNHGVKAVDLIMGVCFEYAKESHATAVMGYSRMDFKAHLHAGAFGATPQGQVNLHDIECKIMYAKTTDLNSHPDNFVAKKIQLLWELKKSTESIAA